MFETQNYIYFIEKTEGESETFYHEKCRFLSKFNIKNESSLNYYLKYANIHCNIKYLGLTYNNKIMNKLNSL